MKPTGRVGEGHKEGMHSIHNDHTFKPSGCLSNRLLSTFCCSTVNLQVSVDTLGTSFGDRCPLFGGSIIH